MISHVSTTFLHCSELTFIVLAAGIYLPGLARYK